MIKGIIFDLDGTTLNTLFDIEDSINKTLKLFNLKEKTYDEVRLAVGTGSRNLLKNCLPKNSSDELIDNALKEYLKIYNNNYSVRTIPYDGIKDLLVALQNKNILIGFDSNKPDNLTKDLVKINFPNIKTVEVIGQTNTMPIKPDPTGANIIIQKMNLSKDEVLFVGDSNVDVSTAHNAGLKCIGCAWGFRGRKALEETDVDYIVSSPEEILNYVNNNIRQKHL